MIQASGLTFQYHSEQVEASPVVKGIDFSIQEGSFVSIIGHNGSGKSTLAKLMNALLVPTAGVLTVTGFSTDDEERLWDIRQQVGMVFQNPDNQIVGTIVEDDVAFGLENLGIEATEMRKRIDESLESVKMTAYLKSQPQRLSGGQKQRVAIAGILAMRPSIIILDEATAMLDPQGRKEVIQLVHKLNREEGLTIVNITHFPEETLESDRIIVMDQGKIYADGTPVEVYADVEGLKAIGLDVPFAGRLRHTLGQQGIKLQTVLDQEELVDELCKYLLKM
ncbi:energy-coupling factor transporter ATPase [Brevibacillus laterosporus]|uniref:Energy-coupling factor transporter ATPase n=1 Tax=Brevibacillus laterosporus TaxID=1465 RepID=A0AAP3DJF9_BRELA|nr:energy-coupling factor transporter ATPase [Brevibacillus laterosporus]AYB41609.1 energy-coupling factor transporter ATPase [Brevibacillus laterosporus]MBG9772275.1 cobalt transporter ATP-binding subunit [Brevibacillus laterosporus]MBG9797054.1 cobalt transporter ATP-binding subunit [Brevibacillus laterosporus]MCR8939725.1 energy-coupling factor transporter ATPase [Brevibacillus laterosporus]MCR8982206.1 energy-coupling factor transporter ATPase [Brevibacillus laterosporus]